MKKMFKYARERAAIAAVLCALAVNPMPAQAQCEVPGVTVGLANTIGQGLKATLELNYRCVQPTGAPGILCIAWNTSTQIAMGSANAALKVFETALYNRLRQFWDDYLEALQDMTGQLNTSLVDGSRGLSGLFDTGGMTANQRELQQVESYAKRQYMPTDEGCRFDTAGAKLGTTTRLSRTVSRALGKQMVDNTTNDSGSIAAKGPASFQAVRWDNYYNLFCDKNMNGGRAACPGSAADGRGGNSQELVNAHIIPAKTIFGKDTIPTNDTTGITGTPTVTTMGAGWKAATDEIVYNLTGYEPPQPIPSDTLQAPGAKDRRMESRAYATQMDAVSALVNGVVAERMPGEDSPEVQQLRQSNGITDANARPSDHEIRQSVLEQLWNPNYYVNLSDSSSATARKEVYLKAYNLMLLYKLIDKTERMANAFVVETANMIDTYQGDALAGDQQSSVPVRP